MTREPIIPQQFESVAEVVRKTAGPSMAWTGREGVAGADGLWHRLANPSPRTGQTYWTHCGERVEGRDARTRLDGDPTCPKCAWDSPA